MHRVIASRTAIKRNLWTSQQSLRWSTIYTTCRQLCQNLLISHTPATPRKQLWYDKRRAGLVTIFFTMILGNQTNARNEVVLPEPSTAPRRKRESNAFSRQAGGALCVTLSTWTLIGCSALFVFSLIWYSSYPVGWGINSNCSQPNSGNETVVITSGLSADKSWTAAKWDHGVVLAVKSYSVLYEAKSEFQDILVVR